MATSLATTLFSNTFSPANHNPTCQLRALSPNNNLSFPLNLNHCIKNSTKQSNKITASAVSNSPGTGIGSSVVNEDTTTLLDKVYVLDLSGNRIPISDIWKDRKAVVAFARHFGCVFCRKRADYLQSKKDRMDASGTALVLIGPGNVDQAKAFSEQTKFREAGLKIIELYMEGYRQDWKLSFEKDTVSKGGWQQGGIIVAGPGKHNVSYIHKDKEAGDDPDIEDVLKACCS